MERTTVNRRYRVDRRIGEGGMAVVYLGQDLLLNRGIAIKAMRPHYAADPAFRARFEREATAAAGFTHPNIVDILDVGEEQGTPFIVMEYVEGESLKDVIASEGPFAPEDVAGLLEQVGSALDYSHERGLVHRDVKPQNILVEASGLAKVVDFGIARGLDDLQLTETGSSLGTAHYLSPEQANGLMATPSSDVYALGIIAFEMLTGRLPFDADAPIALAMQHVHVRPPAPSSLMPGIPPAVDAIVLRALEKDPARRFQTAGAFAQAMTSWNHPSPTGASCRPSAVPTWTASGTTTNAGPDGRTGGSPGAVSQCNPIPESMLHALQLPDSGRDRRGWTTWLLGAAVVLGLIVLIWFGVRLSPLVLDLADGDEDPPAGFQVGPTANTATLEPDAPRTANSGDANASRRVSVPDLTGLSMDAAKDLVLPRGLLIDLRESVFSEAIPPRTIAEQDPPPAASVERGTSVVVKLSRGSATIRLNDLGLVGKSAEAVASDLRGRGLGIEQVEQGSAEVPLGRVIGVEPAERATVGQTVTLFVSAGDAVEIPADLRGQPMEDVRVVLAELGFTVTDIEAADRAFAADNDIDLVADEVEPGDALALKADRVVVNPGALLPRGTEITLLYLDGSSAAAPSSES